MAAASRAIRAGQDGLGCELGKGEQPGDCVEALGAQLWLCRQPWEWLLQILILLQPLSLSSAACPGQGRHSGFVFLGPVSGLPEAGVLGAQTGISLWAGVGITEQFGLGGTSKTIWFHPTVTGRDTFH